jgi:hypothetical protein
MSYANIAILTAYGQTPTTLDTRWKMENGKWRCHFLISTFCFIGWDQELEAGKPGCQFPFSSFQFPLSSFQFPVSSSTQCLTNRRLMAIFLALIGVCCSENWVRFEPLKTLTPLLSIVL